MASGDKKGSKDTSQDQSNIQMSITAEKLAEIRKSANETTKALNEVFNAVSGKNDVSRTFNDLADGIQTAASALDNLQSKVNGQDKTLNNIASVQAQFDGLQSAYANINSKLGDLVKSTDTSALNDVDKIISNIEKMEKSTSDVSKSLKKSLKKMAEDSGNTQEIDAAVKTIENNFLNVSDEIKSKFNELIERQVQNIISGIQASADSSLAAISNGRGLQKKINQSITNTGNSAAYAYQDATVAQQMNNNLPFWNQSNANFNSIANTASEMGVMQTRYESVSSMVRDSYTNAEQEQDPEKRKQLIKDANEQYQNLVAIQRAMNAKAKELGKQMHLVSPDDIKRLGQEGKDLTKHVKNILKETSANSGRMISLGVAFDVKDSEESAKGFAKDKAEIDGLNKALESTNQKTANFAQTAKNELSDAFATLKKPFNAIGKYLPLLGAGGMFGLMNNITKPLQYYSEKHKDMYTSMGSDAYAGVHDLGQSQANADARLMRGNLLYMASGGMIDRRAINNSYNSAIREVGGAYGASPEQGAADINSLVNKTALMQNVMGIDQGTMNSAYQTFYKDMRMSADEAAEEIARCAQTAQASNIPVAKYLKMISGLAQDFMKIGIAGDKAETIMSNLIGRGMRADVAKEVASQTANSMGSFAQNYNMVGYAAAMQGMDPFKGLALASYSHEANGDVRKGWAGDMSKMMDTMLNQYSMAYGDNPDVKRFGVTDTLKKQFGFSQRTASTLASSYLQGDTKQFEKMFEEAMDKKENPNGALEDINKKLAGQLGQMTGQLAGSDRLHALMDGQLYAAADSLGAKMDGIISKLGPKLIELQYDLLYAASEILDFADKFLNSKIWDKIVKPGIKAVLDNPVAAAGTGVMAILANKLFKGLGWRGSEKAAAGKVLSTGLKNFAKGGGRLAAVAALAYGGFSLATSGSSIGQTISDFFMKGNVFDKIYDVLSKIYSFITGKSVDGDKKDTPGGSSSIFDILKNLPGSSFGDMGILGLAGGTLASRRRSSSSSSGDSAGGSSSGSSGSSSSGSGSSGSGSSATDKLGDMASGTADMKKESKQAGNANKKAASKSNSAGQAEKKKATNVKKKTRANEKARKKHNKQARAKSANAAKNIKDAALKNHKSKTKMFGKLGGMASKAKNNLFKLLGKGVSGVLGKFTALGAGAKGMFGKIGEILGPIGKVIGSIAKKVGIGGMALGLASDGLSHLMKGDAVEGDGLNSVVNNALPTLLGGAGMFVGSAAGPLGALGLGALGGIAGSYLNDTETAKWAKNKILGVFGDTDEDQDRKRREQKPWAYDKEGNYNPDRESDNGSSTSNGTDENIENEINNIGKEGESDNSSLDKEAEQANAELQKATGSSDEDMKAVEGGNDSGEEDRQRKADESRMKASKDNSDKVVGQAKKEEKLSTTRNKQLQMFQNLHKQLMQMFQSSVKEEHGNLWKKLDIMEHILFDVNKNIITTGKILNKGLTNLNGKGAPGGGDAKANEKLLYQRLIAAGFSKEQAAGIMGNVSQESGFNSHSGEGSAHQGLFQWDADRWAKLVAFAHASGASEWDAGIQIDFAIQEAQQMGLNAHTMSSDLEGAADDWNTKFERSGEATSLYRIPKAQDEKARIDSGELDGAPTTPPTTPPANSPLSPAAAAAAAALGDQAAKTAVPPSTTPPASSLVDPNAKFAGDDKSKEDYDSGQQMSNGDSNDIKNVNTNDYVAQDGSDSSNGNQNGNQNNKNGNGSGGNGANSKKKTIDRYKPETHKKIDENLAKGLAPNGKQYEPNDIDYLKAHGYTDMEEIKIALNQDKKYAMKPDSPEYLKSLKDSLGSSNENLSAMFRSSDSPFVNNAHFVKSAHGIDAYWSDATTYLPGKSILKDAVKESDISWKLHKPHYSGSDALMAGLYSGHFESAPATKTEKPKASDTANTGATADTTAAPAGSDDAAALAAAADAAKTATDAAKATVNTGAKTDNGTGKPVSAPGNDGAVVNGIGAAMTKQVTDGASAEDQDKSDVQKGTASAKKDKIIDVNINIEAAEENFMKNFGNSLRSAIENTGIKVSSLEQHTTAIAKQVDSAQHTIVDLMDAMRNRQK